MEKRICECPGGTESIMRIRIPPSDSDSESSVSEEMSPATLPSEPELVHRTPLCSNDCILRQVDKLILLGATILFAVLLYHV